MNSIRLGYDINLGLPKDLATKLSCDIVSYHDITSLISDFVKEKVNLAFVPAGTLPYIEKYTLIAQALFGANHQINLRSNFISNDKNIRIESIPNLILGRVNQYCTTSFWSPLIYLMNKLPKGSTIQFQNTESFPDMLHKTAIKIVDASMTWDIIMQQHPEDADKVHEFFYKNDLPTPVMIGTNSCSTETKDILSNFKSSDHSAFFTGFQLPNLQAIQNFITEMKEALEYFKIDSHPKH